MKYIQDQAAQGDLLITRVDSIPGGLTKSTPIDNQHILAHSETGHHHVIDSSEVDYYQPANDELIGFIEVKKPAKIVHLRGWDTHESINLNAGIYQLIRQREYTPDGYRRAAD